LVKKTLLITHRGLTHLNILDTATKYGLYQNVAFRLRNDHAQIYIKF